MARVENIGVHPVKAFERVDVESARISKGGIVEPDRLYAFQKPNGDMVNGIELDGVHDVTTSFDFETEELTASAHGDRRHFDLRNDPDAAAEWFGDVLGVDLTLHRDPTHGFISRPEAGPSVVSTATLAEVASWFDDLTPDDVRRRIRVNVEISGVPAFWEDQFVGDGAPAFEAGGIRFEGHEPCARCVIPQRDPDTGERTPDDFRSTFLERREETFPEWADFEAFEHYFRLMLIASVPGADRGKTLSIGDEVEVVGESRIPDAN
ncbi:MOSC N-terminal beta barrel domain-containing protein [Haloarculaceae archaeon H-GB2-1]|nr:MOSC N-terminal beta barrel domain-containing protein [Haloarculaceae archaeon H-GB1-1]MEA5387919.1 MOSC N-terminal beta barrel domain-containing protein [Haloarculaceae archaeon H-GB11]MEA5409414.1 MOSC N-terminal beta barrel domain-containing protein [Haloarculaceae archaeon H-GB2-1]